FIVEIETASTQKLGDFREKWLESEEFPWEEVKAKLEKESASITLVFEMEKEFLGIQSDDLDYMAYWNKSNSIFFRQYMISEYHRILPNSIIQKAFASKSVKLRQALAKALYGVSSARLSTEQLASNFETLLEDKSYLTVENALIKLWSNFPNKRELYLSQTSNIIGLPNKNVRLLWLTLALITPNYESSNKQDFYKELNGYTASHYNFEVRQSALRYLNEIQALSDESLMNLLKATNHHVWQFKKSSRNLIRELAKNTESKTRLLNITRFMTEKEQLKFQKLINP
ncbi:MAG: M1 family peptidase, partial [Maribacter sp.]